MEFMASFSVLFYEWNTSSTEFPILPGVFLGILFCKGGRGGFTFQWGGGFGFEFGRGPSFLSGGSTPYGALASMGGG